MHDVLDYDGCLEYVQENGHPNTIAAIQRSKANVDPNTCIEFRWGNAETLEERSRCIRGAFKRRSKEQMNEGKCSKYYNATFRVVSG